jgi:hypothetical protein
MAIVHLYHGAPNFNPGAVLNDGLLNGTLAGGDSGDIWISAPDGATVDFTGTITGSFFGGTLDGTITGFKIFTTDDITPPPLMSATGYNFNLKTALVPALTAYEANNPIPLLTLWNVPTTYIGSSDNDTIFDLTTHKCHLHGKGGNDSLVAGLGKDFLYGGPGADHFIFASPADTPVGPLHDVIEDFSHAEHDKIDVSLIDADTQKPGHQTFVYIGSDTFAHYHSLHSGVWGMIRFSGGIVEGNNNHNLAADFAISVNGVGSLVAHDFIL